MSINQYMDDIRRAVESAGIAGTLTHDSIKHFDSLLKENEDHKDTIATYERIVEKNDAELIALRTNLAMAETTVAEYQQVERDLEQREKDITRLELVAEHQSARVDDHKSMVALIFRNSVLRHSAYGNVPGFDKYGNASGAQGSTNDNGEQEQT